MKKEEKRLYDIEYRHKNKERLTKQRKERIDKLTFEEKKQYNKLRYAKLDKIKKANKDKLYAQIHKNKINEKKNIWAKANKDKIKKAKADYVKKMMLDNPFYKLKHYTIVSIRQSLKRNSYTKKSRTYQILGCSFEEFKLHLEAKFESWMNWKNYGNPKDGIYELDKTWDIDHIIPVSSACTEEDVIRLNHYSNLQPLCSYTNRFIKRDKI